MSFRTSSNGITSGSKQDRINFVLSFVQSLPYTLDTVSTGYDEFRRYAIETLIDGGGDCEDTTILVAAILRGLGEKTVLICTPGHIAIGVSGNFSGASVPYNGTEYYYCETTGTGWTVGDLPSSSGTKVTRIIPLTASEIATVPKPNEVVIPAPTPRRPAPDLTPPAPQTPPKGATTETQTDTKSNNSLDTTIVILFILIGLGISTVYFLYRSFKEQRES